MGIMDNEGHDPMGFGNVRSALPMQADPDPRAALKEARAEIARLRAAIKPFALAARGQRFFPNEDEWQQASAVYTNTEPSAHEQKQNTGE